MTDQATQTAGGEPEHVIRAREVLAKLKAAGLRAESDTRNEKINLKVRELSLQKIPTVLVVGKREQEEGTVALRRLGGKDQEILALDDAIAILKEEARMPTGTP